MIVRTSLTCFLIVLLVVLSTPVSSQIDPGYGAFQLYGVLDPIGERLGVVVVVGRSGLGFEAGHEYWLFSEQALLELGELEGLRLTKLAEGEWSDPWVEEALGWQPEGTSVEWIHPTVVEWTKHAEMLPPVVSEGTYFGHATLGGLRIQYSPRGASLTWFRFTEGDFMELQEGALFTREDRVPSTGWWWHGPIDARR